MSLKSSNKTDVNTTELVITIDPVAFEAAVEKEYQRQKKNIQIKGFRKGKVSRKLAEREFGEGAFYEGAINSLLGPEIDAAVKETGLVLVDRPSVDVTSISKEDGVELKAVCVTKPEIEIADYKGIKAPKTVREITDEDIDKQIDIIRKKNARIVSVDDRPAQLEDEVTIDFEGFFGDEAFEGGKGENFELTIGSGQFIPGFEEQLIGMKTEEEKEINVTFPENYHVEELKGQPVIFKVKLHEIKKKVLPELDEELIKDLKIENVNTLDELKEYYRANLLKSRKDWAENKALDEAINKLVEEATVEIPEVMINSMCDNMINEYGQQFMAQGLSMEQFRSMFGENVDGLRNAFRPEAEKRVKTNLCLNKLAELENLNVGAEDLEKYYSDLAETYSMPVEDVKKYIPESNAKEDLKVRKALDFIRQ